MLARLRSWVTGALRRDRIEDEMDAEIRFHMAQHVEDLVARGATRAEAERQARRAFGRIEGVKDACRQARALDAIDAVRRDARYACRLVRRSPGFAFTVVATLALCIGANTAIFSVVDAVLFRPLPYPQPDRLGQVVTYYSDTQHPGEALETSQTGATWDRLREGATSVQWAAFTGSTRLNLVAGRAVEYISQQRVTAGYFSVIGVSPAIGREFTRDEDRPGGARVVVLSHALWQRLFNGAWPLTTPLLLRGEPFTVVGVMPAAFVTTMPADVWTPLRPSRTGEGAGENYTIIGRLKAGVSWPAARASMASLERALAVDVQRGVRARFTLIGLQEALTVSVRRPLLILMAGVVIVLLIGCLNVAGLLVARSLDRTPEIATRIALGCGRSGMVRQLVVESLVLALLGGVAAVALARVAIAWLGHVVPTLGDEYLQSTYGIWQPIRLDGRVLFVTLIVALVTSVLFGLTPALQALRLDIRAGLTAGGGRAVARAATRWPRRLLVVAQIALGVVLLTDAGLLLRSFAHLTGSGPRIDTRNVIAATLPLQDVRYSTMTQVNGLFDRTLTAIKALPGVESAAVTLNLPYERGLNIPFRRTDDAHNQMTVLTYVTPDVFRTLRIPLRRGRFFDVRDTATSGPVVIVNEAFAHTYFRGRDPSVEQVRFLGKARSIVGVVGNVSQKASFGNYEPIDALPITYMPASQMPEGVAPLIHEWFSPSWVVRTRSAQPRLVKDLERVMASIDPQIPFASFRTIDDLKSSSLTPERFQAIVLAGFSALAILLVALGLYGLVAKSVAERTRELGIRLALGSTAARAMRTVALPVVTLSAIGIAGGYALAGLSASLLRNQIWGVSESDPLSIGGAALGLLLLAVVVSFAASWRIARLDPAETLRRE